VEWRNVQTCDLCGDLGLAKPELTLIVQVDVKPESATVGPLSLRERARVRVRVRGF
jgi:hypothetical protein